MRPEGAQGPCRRDLRMLRSRRCRVQGAFQAAASTMSPITTASRAIPASTPSTCETLSWQKGSARKSKGLRDAMHARRSRTDRRAEHPGSKRLGRHRRDQPHQLLASRVGGKRKIARSCRNSPGTVTGWLLHQVKRLARQAPWRLAGVAYRSGLYSVCLSRVWRPAASTRAYCGRLYSSWQTSQTINCAQRRRFVMLPAFFVLIAMGYFGTPFCGSPIGCRRGPSRWSRSAPYSGS